MRLKRLSRTIARKYKTKPEVEDWVKKTCGTCEFNFSGICAAHDSLNGYGAKIDDPSLTCSQWEISLEEFSKERNRYYEKE